MSLTSLLKRSAIFAGLSDSEAEAVAAICQKQVYEPGSIIIQQGDTGDELFVIEDGQVEIVLMGTMPERQVVVLGKGQVLGEMSLLDFGYRSATARATEETTVQVIKEADFTSLCEHDHRIGYIVMRNLAADLSFKLRHRHLATM
jgi:CRP-like cAMP-binding protein